MKGIIPLFCRKHVKLVLLRKKELDRNEVENFGLMVAFSLPVRDSVFYCVFLYFIFNYGQGHLNVFLLGVNLLCLKDVSASTHD